MEEISENHKVVFKHASEALRLQIEKSSVTIVLHDGVRIIGIGSGTCINFQGKKIIATAAHVVKQFKFEQIAICYTKHSSPLNQYVINIKFIGGNDGDELDVAYLCLSDAGIDDIESKKIFLLENRLKPNISLVSNQLFALYGSPRELIDEEAFKRKELAVATLCYVTIALQSLPTGFNADNDLALEYPNDGNIENRTGAPATLPDPSGMSGGGIWLVSDLSEKSIWTPQDAHLVGIDVSWHPTERWIRGNQIQHLTRLIE